VNDEAIDDTDDPIDDTNDRVDGTDDPIDDTNDRVDDTDDPIDDTNDRVDDTDNPIDDTNDRVDDTDDPIDDTNDPVDDTGDVNDSMNSTIARYRAELLKWNARVNLIGPEAREHLDDHIAEAIAAAEILKPQGEVLDFGSGGGLPAIPMAILSPDAHFHLVEADQKKWAFLKHVVRECGLKAQVHGDRLQRLLGRFPANLRFSLVTSRAVGAPEEWVPSLKDHLGDGARIALFQGTPDVPPISGFEEQPAVKLPRGESNYLALLTFHVEQS
jgi:16S rRNA (guanine527-N7)-methyltransferase